MNPASDGNSSGSEPLHPVVLFDGVCNLCHASVRWIIRRDPKGIFRFASLQLPAAEAVLKKFRSQEISRMTPFKADSDAATSARANADPLLSTMYLADPASGRIWSRSDAWIQIVGRLGAPWSWLRVFGILPSALRNAVYDFIARRRYRWFGRKETCPLPDTKLKNRFLD